MTAVFVAMAVSAGMGVGVASGLVAYARRNWVVRSNAAAALDA